MSAGVQDKVAAELKSLGLLWGEGDAPSADAAAADAGEGGGSPGPAGPACGSGRRLELDDLKRLPYLLACVKESMRMFPVVSVMGRWVPGRVGRGGRPWGATGLAGGPGVGLAGGGRGWRAPGDELGSHSASEVVGRTAVGKGQDVCKQGGRGCT